MFKNPRVLVAGAAAGVLAVVLAGFFLYNGKQVVATVNGEPIKAARFYEALEAQAGQETLQHLIAETLIRQAARQENISVDPARVEAQVEHIRGQFPSEAMFLGALQQEGLTLEMLRERVETQMLLEALAQKGVTVTEEEIQEYFEEHKEELGEPARVRARHILVKTEEEARGVLAQLAAGGDFATLAREKSQDPVSREKGGDLGFISPGQMVQEFEKEAFAFPVEKISQPVKTEYGYHIIKVEERKEAVPASLETSRQRVEEQVKASKATPLPVLLEQLRAKANIQIKWDRFKV